MDIMFTRLDEVWTADGVKLGKAHCVHVRPEEEINPDEQLFARYLEVANYEFGDDYYVPFEFIQAHDTNSHRLSLLVSMKDIMRRTWSRRPDFVIKRQGQRLYLTDNRVEGELNLA